MEKLAFCSVILDIAPFLAINPYVTEFARHIIEQAVGEAQYRKTVSQRKADDQFYAID